MLRLEVGPQTSSILKPDSDIHVILLYYVVIKKLESLLKLIFNQQHPCTIMKCL